LAIGGITSAGLPITKESHGLTRSDGKRPEGLTMVPRKDGKPLTWDMTVVCPTAESYVEALARDAGSAAEFVALKKSDKHAALQQTHFV